MGARGSIEYTVGEPMRGTKWVVRGKLGQGGMGLVLDVVKAQLIPGAMKVLLPPFAKSPEFAAKFLDEVRVTAGLQHPNIVQVLDTDRLEDGTPFMVMERLRGRTLRAALRETGQSRKTWTPTNAYAVAAQIAQGLYRAHSHAPSIVHRDVKPENVYLHRTEGSFESVVKVMDFGVSAVVGERDPQRIGTPRYMAPEQVTGDAVSPQTDQHALALVVYEMLTERFPWHVNLRDTSALAEVHRSVPPLPPSLFCPWVPRRIDAAILKALSKDPAARHDTVHGLMFELRSLEAIGSPSPTIAGDSNTTEPMVGTLADGAVGREEHDTFERMPVPSVNGPSLVVPEQSSLSGALREPSEPWERLADARESVPDPSERWKEHEVASSRAVASGAGSGDSLTHGEGRKARSTVVLTPLDTPMTGEAGGPSEEPNRAKVPSRTLRKAVLALVGSSAAVAILVSVRMGSSPREPPNAEVLTAKPLSVPEPAPSAIVEPAAPASTSGVDELSANVEPRDAPSFASAWEPAVAATAAVKADAGPIDSAVKRVPARSSPQARTVAAPMVAVPDDGRNELYIPEAR